MKRVCALLPAFLSLLIALALLGTAGKGLPSPHGPVKYGLAGLDAAIAAPERAAAPRATSDGREEGPDDGLAPAGAAGPQAGPDALPPLPRGGLSRARCALAACARGPPPVSA
jgi:hypothetical protein